MSDFVAGLLVGLVLFVVLELALLIRAMRARPRAIEVGAHTLIKIRTRGIERPPFARGRKLRDGGAS